MPNVCLGPIILQWIIGQYNRYGPHCLSESVPWTCQRLFRVGEFAISVCNFSSKYRCLMMKFFGGGQSHMLHFSTRNQGVTQPVERSSGRFLRSTFSMLLSEHLVYYKLLK